MLLLCFAVQCMLAATRTIFLKLEPVWVIAAVFLGCVIPLFAITALQSDYWADIFLLRCHTSLPAFQKISIPGSW